LKDSDTDVRASAFLQLKNHEADLNESELLDIAGGAHKDIKEWVLTKLKDMYKKGII